MGVEGGAGGGGRPIEPLMGGAGPLMLASAILVWIDAVPSLRTLVRGGGPAAEGEPRLVGGAGGGAGAPACCCMNWCGGL